MNPTTEDHYWRSAFVSRPYVVAGSRYEEYEPAFMHGIQMRERFLDQSWEEAEPEIKKAWEESSHSIYLNWERAQPAIQDAWDHLSPEPAEPEVSEAERESDV